MCLLLFISKSMFSECAWYLYDYWALFIYYFKFTYVIRRIVLLWTLPDTAAMLPGQQQSEASREWYQKRWDSGRHRNVDLSPHETAEHNWARDSHLAGRAHPKGRRGSPRHSPGCLLICRCRAILQEWGWRRRSTIEIYGHWINGNSLL